MAEFYWGALRHKEGVQGLISGFAILVTFSALPCTQFWQITPVCCSVDMSSECWPQNRFCPSRAMDDAPIVDSSCGCLI